ncbi:hypothetical protein SESBI_10316 [Sesbania bispinosa]|nr:hypothetical protein SESBI_10316 [Sesbania bispinosa]
MAPTVEGEPATAGATTAEGAKPAANDHQATEINLSQSAPLSQGIQDYEIQPTVSITYCKTTTSETKWNVRAPIHTTPPPLAPPAARPRSPASVPPPTGGVSQDTFQAASRGVQQRSMQFMPTPRLQQNPPSKK